MNYSELLQLARAGVIFIRDRAIILRLLRNIIKSGKRIERFDLYARLGLGREVLVREVNRMIPRIEKSGMDVKKDKLEEIRNAVEEQEVDYYGVIKMLEALIA